jgi:phytoene dehydrogenase-like protein
LLCASILARGGVRVVVIDPGKRAGGRIQTLSHQGFAVDLGPLTWDASGFEAALAAAGIGELKLCSLPLPGSQRCAVVQNGRTLSGILPLPLPGGTTSPSMLDAVRRLYTTPPRVFATLGELYAELAELPPSEVGALREVTLDAWLALRQVEPAVAAAFRRSVALLGGLDPGGAPMASIAVRARSTKVGGGGALLAPGDNPVAGGRGIVQAIVDALIDHGAELRLGTRVTGMAIDRGRFRALSVQREEHPFADEVVADRCVLAMPPASLEAILPAEPRAALLPYCSGTRSRASLGVAWAFREAPRTSSGASSTQPGVLRLASPPPAANEAPAEALPPASLVWASAHGPRVAPPDRALLLAQMTLPAETAADAYQIGMQVALLRGVVGTLYRGAEELIEWEHHWLLGSAPPDPFLLPRTPMLLPGFDGLFQVGDEVAVEDEFASGVAAAALSAVHVAQRILAR